MGCKQVSSKGDDPKKPKEGEEKKDNVDVKANPNPENKEGDKPQVKEGEDKVKEGEDKKEDAQAQDKDIVIEGQPKEENYKLNVMRNNQIVWSKLFPPSIVINTVIEQFQKENMNQGAPLDPEAKILINGAIDFDASRMIKDFIQYANTDKEILVVIIDPVKSQNQKPSQSNNNNIPENAFELLKEEQNLFVKPHLNPFGLIIYNSKKGLVFKSFSQSSIEQNSFNLYSNTSAYCNAKSCVFLSGGERNGQIEGNFWIIQMPSVNILYMGQCMAPKKSHSMIYIPNSYVFMVGGNTKNVICFDLNQKTFNDWGSLNKDRIEPSLAFMDNRYLYAISYTKNDLSFERCNLRKEIKWKLITPKLSNSSVRFSQKFFSIIHQDKDTVLFFGGCQMNEEQGSKCFEFHHKSKELEPSKVPFKEIDFIEKTFSFMNPNMACLIPSCSLNDMNVILFNLDKMESETVHFQQDKKIDKNSDKKKQSVIQSLKLENLQLNLNMPNCSLNQEVSPSQMQNQQGNVQGLIQMN